MPPWVLSLSFIWLFVGVNVLGVRSGGRVQVITSLLKIVPLLLVMVLGPIAILAEPATYTANLPTTPPVGLQPSMAAAAIALYAMLGFESATIAAGRARDPERTIPRATLIGTLVVAIIYVAIVGISMLLVPQATLATSDAPFVTITDSLLGAGYGRWIALFVVISGLGCLNGWTLVVAELGRTLAIKKLDARGDGPHQPLRRALDRATGHRRRGDFHGADELQRLAGRRIHQALRDRDRREPAALSLRLARRSSCSGSASPASRRPRSGSRPWAGSPSPRSHSSASASSPSCGRSGLRSRGCRSIS